MIEGALSYEIGLDLVVTSVRLLQSDPTHPGSMAIVGASQERVYIIHELGLDDRLVIAEYNGPESHVISGEIEAFLSIASIRGFRTAKVKVDKGRLSSLLMSISFHISASTVDFHSPCIPSALPALQEWLNEHHHFFTPLNIPLYSTVYGKEIRRNQRLTPDYWGTY